MEAVPVSVRVLRIDQANGLVLVRSGEVEHLIRLERIVSTSSPLAEGLDLQIVIPTWLAEKSGMVRVTWHT